MDIWTVQSSPGKQRALAIGCLGVGLILAIGFGHYGAWGDWSANDRAGCLLGGLLLAIGGCSLPGCGRQTIHIDPQQGRILIVDASLFLLLATKKRSIAFADIVAVRIGYLGRRSNAVTFYFLVLQLKGGEEYPLFAPGRFFPGASNRAIVAGWQQRLIRLLGSEKTRAEKTNPT